MNYLWIKAFHIISMVAWFAGLFYIFRLYVYHAKFRNESALREAYTLMEKKLITIIMNPAMVCTAIFGVLMITMNPLVLEAPWFQAKLSLLLPLIGYHVFSIVTHRRFARGDFFLSEKACRYINEVPTLLMISIIILVVVKIS